MQYTMNQENVFFVITLGPCGPCGPGPPGWPGAPAGPGRPSVPGAPGAPCNGTQASYNITLIHSSSNCIILNSGDSRTVLQDILVRMRNLIQGTKELMHPIKIFSQLNFQQVSEGGRGL